MPTLLLDTSVIIDALRNRAGRVDLLRKLVEDGSVLACCAVNVTEVFAGMRANEEEPTVALLSSLELLPIDWDVARLAGNLKREYSRKGKTVALADVTIAAVALRHNAVLMTDNVKDFPMRELQLFRVEPR